MNLMMRLDSSEIRLQDLSNEYSWASIHLRVKSYARMKFLLREWSKMGWIAPFVLPPFLLCEWFKMEWSAPFAPPSLLLCGRSQTEWAAPVAHPPLLLCAKPETERAAPFAPHKMSWSNPISSPSFLSKTIVRVFLLSKYNGQELKNELT